MRRVLAIDGGGILGLMPALVLAELERRSGRPCRSMFDLLAGTSTGGIIACGLAIGLPATRLVSLYEDDGPTIFSEDLGREMWQADGLRGPRYDVAPLEGLLRQLLGDAWLSGVGPAGLVVPVSRCDAAPPAVVLGSGSALDPDLDYPLWQVARATSAAPTYFAAATVQARSGKGMTAVDGGLWANDPSAVAVAEAQRRWPGEALEVLSLGTGGVFQAVPAKPDWGGIDWLPYVVEYMMRLSEAAAAAAPMPPGSTRTRLDPALDSAMDDASPGNVAAMKVAAATLVEDRGADLDRFAAPVA